jgi:hypothetical protein
VSAAGACQWLEQEWSLDSQHVWYCYCTACALRNTTGWARHKLNIVLNINRYEKYDAPMGKRRETKGDDPYQEEYDLIMSQVEDLNRVSRCLRDTTSK